MIILLTANFNCVNDSKAFLSFPYSICIHVAYKNTCYRSMATDQNGRLDPLRIRPLGTVRTFLNLGGCVTKVLVHCLCHLATYVAYAQLAIELISSTPRGLGTLVEHPTLVNLPWHVSFWDSLLQHALQNQDLYLTLQLSRLCRLYILAKQYWLIQAAILSSGRWGRKWSSLTLKYKNRFIIIILKRNDFSLINWFQKATFLKTNVVWIAVAFFPQRETIKTLSLKKDNSYQVISN